MIVAAVICDRCGEMLAWDHVGKTYVKDWARKNHGWSIGKQDLCPKCRKTKK